MVGIKIDTCLVVGLGGIGSQLIEPLARLLMYHPNGTWKIFVCDGDTYEHKNRVRQLFDPRSSNLNKAIATCERLAFAPNLMAHPDYLNNESADGLLRTVAEFSGIGSTLLVVMCVDNHASRKLLIRCLDDQPSDYILINASNGYETVQVSLHIRFSGEPLTVHPFERYKDIANPDDSVPGGCAKEAPSTPQLLVANSMAANGALIMVNSLLDGKATHDEIAGDVYKQVLKPLGSKKVFSK